MEQAPQMQKSDEDYNGKEKCLLEKYVRDFNTYETILFHGVELEVTDILPEEITDSTPVLFVAGFGKSAQSYKEALYETYKAGRRIVSVKAPTEDIDLTPEDIGSFPKAQAERAQAMLHVLKEKHIGQVDVIAHSEGGLNVSIAASIAPKQFRHFAFVALPGVTDKQSYIEIALRGIRNLKFTKEEKKNADMEIVDRFQRSEEEIKKWVHDRGAVKATIESMNPGRIDIVEEIKRLHDTGHGVSIISGVDDAMLPMKEYQHTKDGEGRSADDFGIDGFYSVKKGHGEIEVNGEMGYLATEALDSLRKKYSGEVTESEEGERLNKK